MPTHKGAVSLPSATSHAETHITQIHTESQVQARTSAAPLRVLVIDDEPLIRRAIARCLPGHDVVCTGNADDALHLALSQEFALVLCDLYMPGTSAGQLYAVLRNEKPELAERMVVITGGASNAAMERFLQHAGLPVLAKPFRSHELRQVVALYAPQPAPDPPPAATAEP